MVAELLCTTRVITAPSTTPRTGISDTLPIRSTNIALLASGFITPPMTSIPSKRSPNENMTIPTFLIFSFLNTKFIMKPINMIGYM